MSVPGRQVRAVFTDETVTVYQVYSPDIAGPALRVGRFVPPFKRAEDWVKPSFLWMMYRCGWATKPGQERVLAIEITHLQPPPYRSPQLGLSGPAVDRYVDQWLIMLTDVTAVAGQVRTAAADGDLELVARLLPAERPYPLPANLAGRCHATRE